MDAAYTKKTAVVVLDATEVLLIMIALADLTYSYKPQWMSGLMRSELAGLSKEWRDMTMEQQSPQPERITHVLDVPDVMSRIVKELYGPECSWEVY